MKYHFLFSLAQSASQEQLTPRQAPPAALPRLPAANIKKVSFFMETQKPSAVKRLQQGGMEVYDHMGHRHSGSLPPQK